MSNEKTNALTMYGTLYRYVTIFYWQELGPLFQVQEKLKVCKNSKLNFSSSCVFADDILVGVYCLGGGAILLGGGGGVHVILK